TFHFLFTVSVLPFFLSSAPERLKEEQIQTSNSPFVSASQLRQRRKLKGKSYEMSMQTRRSSLAKKNTAAVSVGDAPPTKKMTAAAGATNLGRKRAPLGDITNNRTRIHATAHKGSKTALTLNSQEQNSTKTACKVTPVPSKEDAVVSSKSDGVSTSIDESMSTCDSYKDTDEKIVNIDADVDDPQLCATNACDIYKHLRASETKKRPASDFMERTQKDINASMRAILIDWLVEVAEEYRLVPDTLYLTVNYIDRYLSGNVIDRQKLQLLGVACMMIAAKYEEICAPQVEEFCYITDNTYFKDELLEMESAVLDYLKFEMTAPTAKCFLRRFIRAAQGLDEVPSMQLECLANYISELSLLEYNMLRYAPSIVAASSIFLAKFILFPSKKPWNSTLQHYTLYQPNDLLNCVRDLQRLCCSSNNPTLPAISEKYSTHKYKCVAKKFCPPHIPEQYFHKLS
ncbi:CYCA1-1, partial [Linum grandiflorum]